MGSALGECPRDDLPGARLGSGLVRESGSLGGARASHERNRSERVSRPRRRREFAGPARQLEQACNLAGRVAEHVERSTITARCSGVERGERGERCRSEELGRMVGRRGLGHRPLRAGAGGPRPVDCAIDDDPVQPRAERPSSPPRSCRGGGLQRGRPPGQCPRRRRRRGRRETRPGKPAASCRRDGPRSPRPSLPGLREPRLAPGEPSRPSAADYTSGSCL